MLSLLPRIIPLDLQNSKSLAVITYPSSNKQCYASTMTVKQFFSQFTKRGQRQAFDRRFISLAALTLVGVAVLQLIFAAVYLTAFHAPAARDLPVAIVGDNAVTEQLGKALEQKSDHAYKAILMTNLSDAETQLKTQQVYAIYQPVAPQGTVTIAGANGTSLVAPLTTSLTQLDHSYQAQVRQQLAGQPIAASPIETPIVSDIAPLPAGDRNGVSLFYVAFASVFGGYLAAVAVNLVRGKRAFSRRLAAIRIAGFAIFAVVVSIGTSLIVTHGVDAISVDQYWTLAGVAALTTFGVSLVASALVSLFGVLGTALVIVLFVIFGTPASGGPVPLLLTGNGPWHELAAYLPTGAAFNALRQSVYFGGIDMMSHLWILVGYVAAGSIVLLGYGARRSSVSSFEDDIADTELHDKAA